MCTRRGPGSPCGSEGPWHRCQQEYATAPPWLDACEKPNRLIALPLMLTGTCRVGSNWLPFSRPALYPVVQSLQEFLTAVAPPPLLQPPLLLPLPCPLPL